MLISKTEQSSSLWTMLCLIISYHGTFKKNKTFVLSLDHCWLFKKCILSNIFSDKQLPDNFVFFLTLLNVYMYF